MDFNYMICFFLAFCLIACSTSLATSLDHAAVDPMAKECYRNDCSLMFNINKNIRLHKGGHEFVGGIDENIEDCRLPL
jgi:hypothetical protein